MGCGTSNLKEGELPVKAVYSKTSQNGRADKKHQKINGRLQAEEADKMYENVTLVEGETMSKASEQQVLEILKHHFFFYGLSNLQRSQVVRKMVQCKAEGGSYVFKQGDLATAFFMIADGRVQVQITGQKKRILQKGDYFGELALIYMAPRSASIKALVPTQFWCITRNTFRQTVEDYVKKNYAIAKEYIDKFPLFASLTEKQRDSVAYNMLSLKYQNEQVIFKINDDANSFFIVTKGSVQINIPNKNKLLLGVGESFGEQSFLEQQVRGGTAIAREQTICLSIGRDVIKNILGDRIYNISNYNITKWALKRSQILTKLSNVQIEKLLETVEFRSFQDKDVVFKKDDKPKFIVIPIEGSVEDKSHGQIAGEAFLNYNQGQTIDRDYLKIGKGSVAIINFEDITRITNKKTTQLMNVSGDTYEKQMELNTRKIIDYSHITLENLVHMKKLGEGQFGRVYLVRESKGSPNMYALKCIKKQQVISNKMEKIILEEKRILSQINFPLVVSFVKSFKDNHFIYLLMEYVKGFELFDIIREIGIVPKVTGRFYMSSLVLSIEYLHLKNIIYRDLKPENVMVENDGHLKLIDMGTAKKLTSNKGFRTFTMIGTPHYMAPEVMHGKGYTFAADIWSLGVVLYEFLCGELPFANKLEEPHEIHKCIVQSTLEFPSFFTDEKAKKLLCQLLNKIPELRLPKGFPSLKANPYFDGINWQDIYNKKIKSPYIPKQAKIPQKPIPDGGSLLNIMLKQKAKTGIYKQSSIRDWDAQF